MPGVELTRATLFRRAAAAAVAAGGAAGVLAGPAGADPIPLQDLAYARLLVGAELLSADYYTQAIAASNTGPVVEKYLERALSNEEEHYHSVAGILSGSGNPPAVSGDIDFSYPAGTFASERSILEQATKLEALVLGAYLGAIGSMQTAAFKTGLAQIAACEAQHQSYFNTRLGGRAFSLSFPPALTIEQASDAMGAYTA